MIKRKVTLGGTVPFTAQRAQQLVALANIFSANILLQDRRGSFNGKSLLGVLSLGKLTGLEVTLIAEGVDEEAAVDALTASLEAENEPSLT